MTTKSLPLSEQFPDTSRLVYGCMGLGGGWDQIQQPLTEDDHRVADTAIDAALAAGITFFDHADIYAGGKAEAVFGERLKRQPSLRDQIILQSKCGIRFADEHGPQRFDFSPEWINESVDNSLRRLHTDHLDILLLHRPDPLMEPEAVAEVFARLQQSGKVRQFGVSNMDAHQMALLQDALDAPLLVNQIELSLSRLDFLNQGVDQNTASNPNPTFAPGTLEYCRRNSVQLQSWGCLSQGLFSGRDVTDQPAHIQQSAQLVADLAAQHGVSREAIVLAWLMRHPAGIQPVIGTTNPDRIAACAEANGFTMNREDWYRLFEAARGQSVP